MNTEQKFITDASLAGLAKWLRILGYDTVVYGNKAGRPMMRQAQNQERILLTRRRDMLERQFSGVVLLLPAVSTGQQLNFVICKLTLKINHANMYRICLICNHMLHPVMRDNVRNSVPPYVYENCEKYNQCDSCGRIYWSGTHVQNALRFLKENNINITTDAAIQ
ncbi:MAG: Mut7-C RNAse domain-containing protein [Smithellaceae bacterium]